MIAGILTAVVGLALGAWLLATVLYQWGRTRAVLEPVTRRDLCSLIPAWTFFAPNPGRTDTHVLSRDLYGGGEITPWRAVTLRSRPPWLSSSDGQRRVSKGVVDVQADLLTPQPGEVDDEPSGDAGDMRPVAATVFLGSAYLMLLSLVSRRRHDPFARATQFAVATTAGPGAEGDPIILFLSAWHELPRPLPAPARPEPVAR